MHTTIFSLTSTNQPATLSRLPPLVPPAIPSPLPPLASSTLATISEEPQLPEAITTPLLTDYIQHSFNPDLLHLLPREFYQHLSRFLFSGFSTMVKNTTTDISAKFALFLAHVEKTLSNHRYGSDAPLFCIMFRQDIEYLFYNQAIKELRTLIQTPDPNNNARSYSRLSSAEYQNRQNTSITSYRTWLTLCQNEFDSIHRVLTQRKNSFPLPDYFHAKDLWFATSPNCPIIVRNCLTWEKSQNNQVGSLYFTGGRIRLIHEEGPCINIYDNLNTSTYIRAIGNFQIRQNDTNENFRAYAVQYCQQKTNNHHIPYEKITLAEYKTLAALGCIDKAAHISRGFPQKINLSEEEIQELFWLIRNIQSSRISRNRKNEGNIILREYFLRFQALGQKLGYN